MKKIKILFGLLLLVVAVSVRGDIIQSGFDRTAFYNALANDDLSAINTQLTIIKASSINEKEAYEGALLMKKAGLATKAKEKLSLFKEGRSMLESSIKKDNSNTEYNFLRLIIQENAPKVVNYNKDIDNDIAIIRSNFKNLPHAVQQAIRDYSKKSKKLNTL